jgi:hypothetical protein
MNFLDITQNWYGAKQLFVHDLAVGCWQCAMNNEQCTISNEQLPIDNC